MFTFGSDPEFMLFHKSDSKYKTPVSAIKHIPGSRYSRHRIGNHECFYDNVLAECAIKYGETKEETVENIRDCFQQLSKILKSKDLVFQAIAAREYPAKELDDPEALKAGCDPETCVYSLTEIEKEDVFHYTKLRSAGGHIHLGAEVLEEPYKDTSAVKMLDLFLGIPSIFIDHDKSSKKRKELYGQAGRYRQKDYGVEYRTLGNFWLNSPKYVELIYDICMFTVDFVNKNRHLEYWRIDTEQLEDDDCWNDPDWTPSQCYECKGYDVVKLRMAIENMDRKTGKEFMKLIQDVLPPEIFKRIEQATTDNMPNLYEEWGLN